MSSEKEKFQGFRPYFKEEVLDDKPVPLKDISLMPSTMETIDLALYDWVNEEMIEWQT